MSIINGLVKYLVQYGHSKKHHGFIKNDAYLQSKDYIQNTQLYKHLFSFVRMYF